MALNVFACTLQSAMCVADKKGLLRRRVIYGSAGVQLGSELAEGNVWPDPPQPCGIIAGTQSLSPANPTSWLSSAFGMISGMPVCGQGSACIKAPGMQSIPEDYRCWSVPCADEATLQVICLTCKHDHAGALHGMIAMPARLNVAP